MKYFVLAILSLGSLGSFAQKAEVEDRVPYFAMASQQCREDLRNNHRHILGANHAIEKIRAHMVRLKTMIRCNICPKIQSRKDNKMVEGDNLTSLAARLRLFFSSQGSIEERRDNVTRHGAKDCQEKAKSYEAIMKEMKHLENHIPLHRLIACYDLLNDMEIVDDMPEKMRTDLGGPLCETPALTPEDKAALEQYHRQKNSIEGFPRIEEFLRPEGSNKAVPRPQPAQRPKYKAAPPVSSGGDR